MDILKMSNSKKFAKLYFLFFALSNYGVKFHYFYNINIID